MPITPSCKKPSPPSYQISPEMTRMEKNPTQYTPKKVVNASLGEEQAVASYEGRLRLVHLREDLCTLLPHRWVNNNIVQWMCLTFNDSESLRFKDDFYCIPPGILRNLVSFREVPTVSYVGLDPHFGANSRYFDKERTIVCMLLFRYGCLPRSGFYLDVAYDRD
ncbi:uncharacterized protein DS421_4g122340 [Arachis hypogaea]|nr:uncharacterized protein DS421_4g122340 [Arachis hypogaea]